MTRQIILHNRRMGKKYKPDCKENIKKMISKTIPYFNHQLILIKKKFFFRINFFLNENSQLLGNTGHECITMHISPVQSKSSQLQK